MPVLLDLQASYSPSEPIDSLDDSLHKLQEITNKIAFLKNKLDDSSSETLPQKMDEALAELTQCQFEINEIMKQMTLKQEVAHKIMSIWGQKIAYLNRLQTSLNAYTTINQLLEPFK